MPEINGTLFEGSKRKFYRLRGVEFLRFADSSSTASRCVCELLVVVVARRRRRRRRCCRGESSRACALTHVLLCSTQTHEKRAKIDKYTSIVVRGFNKEFNIYELELTVRLSNVCLVPVFFFLFLVVN